MTVVGDGAGRWLDLLPTNPAGGRVGPPGYVRRRLAAIDSERKELMLSDRLKAALKDEGSAAFVTQGPNGPHLVATWNSYLDVVDDDTIVFPAGGYRTTEDNLKAGSPVQMVIGGHVPEGVGFRLIGRAALEVGTPHHSRVKQRFPWARAAVVLRVTAVEQVLGK